MYFTPQDVAGGLLEDKRSVEATEDQGQQIVVHLQTRSRKPRVKPNDQKGPDPAHRPPATNPPKLLQVSAEKISAAYGAVMNAFVRILLFSLCSLVLAV